VKDISHFEIRPDGRGAMTRPVRGFTLIELMVVLVIISMFSAMIVPSIAAALRGTGLRSTGNQVCEVLNFAYMSAVTRHRPVVVNIDAGRRLCWVSAYRSSLPWLAEPNESETQTLATMELPEGTRLTVTRGETSPFSAAESQPWEVITFRSDGGTEDALIELTSMRGERFEIEILGATGEVRGREVLL
jgi:prepilin-type N-terminal cleavage/methylation domain-containing protein